VLTGSVAMPWVYLRKRLEGRPQYDGSYPHTCLRMAKRAANARVSAERARLWHASHPAPGFEWTLSPS